MIIRVNENFMGYGKNAEIGREVLDILKHYTPNFETSKIDPPLFCEFSNN